MRYCLYILILPVNEKMNLKFLFVSLATFTNSKDCYESASSVPGFRLSFALIGKFVYINGGLSEQFSESQAAFGKTFSAMGRSRLWVAGTSFLNRITERIFTISKLFHRSKKKLYSSQKDSQKS
jgi:hypothetical protein